MSKSRQKLFIDAQPILDRRMSGVGQVALQTIKGLVTDKRFASEYDIFIIVPYWKRKALDKFPFLTSTKKKFIPLPSRIINLLLKENLLPSVDLFFGKGVYLFLNYKNWPLRSSRSITYVHDVTHLSYPEFVEPRNRKMLQTCLPRWLDRADVVVTVSDASAKEIKETMPQFSEKIRVVKNGVDLTFYRPIEKETIAISKEKYGIQGEYLFYLSNLEPRKNINRLLDALVLGEDDIKARYSLLIVGGMGWLNEETMFKINALKKEGWNIIKPDVYVPDEDIPALLSGAKALVQPSIHEGFGISPLYALACGVIPVISDIPAHREVCGGLALYFNPISTDDILEKIKLILKSTRPLHDREKMIIQASKLTQKSSHESLVDVIGELSK